MRKKKKMLLLFNACIKRVHAVAQSVQRLGYGLDNQDSNPVKGNDGNFSLLHRIRTGSGPKQPPIQ
jgi:hypothetical protein